MTTQPGQPRAHPHVATIVAVCVRQAEALAAGNWFNPNLDYLWFTVPNLIGMLSMVVGLIVTALSVARERELGIAWGKKKGLQPF